MATYALTPHYLRAAGAIDPRRVLAFAGIAALHVIALAALFVACDTPAQPQAARPMMVTFISEAPPQPEPMPPPPKPVKPKPQPKMIATPKPSPSAITVPPIEEKPVETAPIDEVPPPPPSPPAPTPTAPTAPTALTAPPTVTPPNFVAAYLNNPGPRYPSASIRSREQGTVMLLVLVNAQGRAEKVTVDTGSGHARLDEAAVEVVRERWRFVAAKQGDQAVAAWVKVPITFELKQH